MVEHEGTYRADLRDGEFRQFYPDGTLAERTRWKRGVLTRREAFGLDGRRDPRSSARP